MAVASKQPVVRVPLSAAGRDCILAFAALCAEKGMTWQEAHAYILSVGWKAADIAEAYGVGVSVLPKPQSYLTDHHRFGEVHPQQMFLDSEADN